MEVMRVRQTTTSQINAMLLKTRFFLKINCINQIFYTYNSSLTYSGFGILYPLSKTFGNVHGLIPG